MVTILAFLTMFIDHTGLIFFPWDDIWRIIWRVSFPLFAWWIVRWYKLTKNRLNYAKRIFVLAIISQIPLFFISWNELYNICFTLLFWLISLEIIENEKIKIYLKIISIIIMLYLAQLFNFDYWIYWILSIILIYFTWQKKMSILYFFILTFLFYGIDYDIYKIHFHLQLYAVLALVILYLTPIQKYDFKINFYVKYWFYPAHLTLLYLIKVLW